jgi:hypothetical protein
MHKSATKCNETVGKWCKNKHGASKIIDTFETYCNETSIKIAHNPVQHERTKHIDIRHHFLRDHVNLGNISLMHVKTEEQLEDIFTKPLDEAKFCRLRHELGILDPKKLG